MSLYNPSIGAPISTTQNPMHRLTVGTPYHGSSISQAQLAAQYNRNRHYIRQNNHVANCQCQGCVRGQKCVHCVDTHEAAYCCDHLSCNNHPRKSCPN